MKNISHMMIEGVVNHGHPFVTCMMYMYNISRMMIQGVVYH